MPGLYSPDLIDARRFCGYAITDQAIDGAFAQVFADTKAVVLDNLAKLRAMRDAIAKAADNLDTNRAAVWYRNPTEIADRQALYYFQRLSFCNDLGVAPGLFIGPISVSDVAGSSTSATPVVFVV